ncbi:MAG: hypothetical protein JO284_00640 [Planctomycetaceae bacterium]|nr:hypothetical protein [Planctomycetaceae bacterium]
MPTCLERRGGVRTRSRAVLESRRDRRRGTAPAQLNGDDDVLPAVDASLKGGDRLVGPIHTRD